MRLECILPANLGGSPFGSLHDGTTRYRWLECVDVIANEMDARASPGGINCESRSRFLHLVVTGCVIHAGTASAFPRSRTCLA